MHRWVLFGLLVVAAGSCSNGDGDGDSNSTVDTSDDSTGTGGPACAQNGVADGDETDIDCGGPLCPACDMGQECLLPSDCASMACVDSVCSSPSCTDGGLNQGETDVDCGGPCPPCGTGLGCGGNGDCESQKCMDGTCAAPDCSDGILNGSESDVDCGGSNCPGCQDGEDCGSNDDCSSGYCDADICAAKACEGDDDCSELTNMCQDGVCSLETFTCEAVPTVDCSDLDDECVVGVCNPDDGTCGTDAVNEDMACDDGDACTVDEVCQAGTCVDLDGPNVHIDEDFADNAFGWNLGDNWEIGSATASAQGQAGTGMDPAMDHTATDDNGVAGVLLGGLTSGSQQFTYLESPSLDLQAATGDLSLSLWRWLNSDVDPKMTSVIEVRDGNSWTVLWENDGNMVVADDMWTQHEFDVTNYKSADFRVRIGYKATGAAADVGGWNVDDVLLAPPQCEP